MLACTDCDCRFVALVKGNKNDSCVTLHHVIPVAQTSRVVQTKEEAEVQKL